MENLLVKYIKKLYCQLYLKTEFYQAQKAVRNGKATLNTNSNIVER